MSLSEPEDGRLSERDLRALAMEMALQLPRDEADAQRVLDLMRAGYEYFLCEYKRPSDEVAGIIRPKFSRRRGGG